MLIKVAVLMLTKNSSQWLDEVLGAIQKQLGNYEISLVDVDGNSLDDTRKKIKSYFPDAIIIQDESRNLAHLRNIVLQMGQSLNTEYMAFIDSDVVVPNNFFSRLIPLLNDKDVGIVGLRFELERDPPKGFVAKFYRDRLDIKRKGIYKTNYTTTACSLWKSKTSKDIVIDERLVRAGEDVTFNMQITGKGYVALVDADDPPAWHIRPATVREELHRVKDHGLSRALTMKIHKHVFTPKQRYKTFFASNGVLMAWICLFLTPFIGLLGLLPFATYFFRHWLKCKNKLRLDYAFFGFLLGVIFFTRYIQGVIKYA